MADTLINTLYPPVIETFLPAFINTEAAPVVFSTSPFNASQNITYVHVALIDATNNESAFKKNAGDGGTSNNSAIIKNHILILKADSPACEFDPETSLYRIKLDTQFLKKNITEGAQVEEEGDTPSAAFKINQYYKLQVRFANSTPTSVADDDYLTGHTSEFSEWSTVALLRPISQPQILLEKFTKTLNDKDDKNTVPQFAPGLLPVLGYMSFLDGQEKERLESYTWKVFEYADDTIGSKPIIESPGKIFVEGLSSKISTYIDMSKGVTGKKYVLEITGTTKNQFLFTEQWIFSIGGFLQDNIAPWKPTWKATMQKEDGVIRFSLSNKGTDMSGRVIIRRSCSKDNFEKKELIACIPTLLRFDNLEVADYTVASLYGYKYYAQFENNLGTMTPEVGQQELIGESAETQTTAILPPFYPTFEDIIISRGTRQLAVRYNPQISGLKPVVNRVKIDTLGGKYPRFAENAQMNYKQYSLSGLISAESDFNRRFLSELPDSRLVIGTDGTLEPEPVPTAYSETMDLYNDYFGEKYQIRNDALPITPDSDKITYEPMVDRKGYQGDKRVTSHIWYPTDNVYWEREFREEALKWLNDGEPKLFRSMQEGNLAVMITDVSLTPIQQVNRMLYSFNATLYEIADADSLENLSQLGITNTPTLEDLKTKIPSGELPDNGDPNNPDFIPAFNSLNKTIIGQRYHETICSFDDIVSGSNYHNSIGDNTVQQPILSDLKTWYSGALRGKTPGSCSLKNVQIQFHNKPHLFKTNSLGGLEEVKETTDINTPLLVGYVFSFISTLDPQAKRRASAKDTQIFVNERGFYQIPDNITIEHLFFQKGDVVTIDYLLKYKEVYDESVLPNKVSNYGTVVGQESGMFIPYESIGSRVYKKYFTNYYSAGSESSIAKLLATYEMTSWHNLSIDTVPYAACRVQYTAESFYQTYLVGRTGVLNLTPNYPIRELQFLGRQMFQETDISRQPYLDDWEYVLDPSADGGVFLTTLFRWEDFENPEVLSEDNLMFTLVEDTNSQTTPMDFRDKGYQEWLDFQERVNSLGYKDVSEVENPQYNTVYGFYQGDIGGTPVKTHKIYFKDGKWYPILLGENLKNENVSTQALARIPVYGLINYQGDILCNEYTG